MKTRAVIDRFEENKAVLLVGEKEDRQVQWFRQDLPPEACEGDILYFSVEVDTEATEQAKNEVDKLLRKLTGQTEQAD